MGSCCLARSFYVLKVTVAGRAWLCSTPRYVIRASGLLCSWQQRRPSVSEMRVWSEDAEYVYCLGSTVRCYSTGTDSEAVFTDDEDDESNTRTDDLSTSESEDVDSETGSDNVDSETGSDVDRVDMQDDVTEVEEEDDNEDEHELEEHASDSDSLEVVTDDEMDLDEEIRRQIEPEPKPKKIIRRPSVTWGILLTQEQRRIAHENVIQFLKEEGISTSELMGIELPTTVEVMKQRLSFLHKIGFQKESINHYPLVLGCSVYKNMVPVLRYLNRLGLPRHCVAAFLRKYPMILHASVVIDILPVIYFLRGLDVAREDIPLVLLRYPEVLGFRTEGTMSTSVAYLVSIGVRMRYVGQMLTEYPLILGMRVASMIKPRVDYLMSLGLPQDMISRILERRPQILGYNLVYRMQHNVNLLLKAGVRKEALLAILSQYPEIMGRVLTDALDDKVAWFHKILKLGSDGLARMIERMPQVIFLHKILAMRRIEFLKSCNLTAEDIGEMATRCPQVLVLDIDEYLRPNLTFLVKDMKRPLREVIDFPEYLTYGLETRIRPRYKTVIGKGLQWCLEDILNCSDLEFVNRVRAHHVEEDISLAFSMGGPLPKQQIRKQEEPVEAHEQYESLQKHGDGWQLRIRDNLEPKGREKWQPREQQQPRPRERRFILS